VFSIFPQKRRWLIGLDIGSDSIKMLQLRRVGQVVSVRGCQRWKFPDSADNDPKQRRDMAVQAVRDMLRSGSFQGKRVVSALSCGQLNIKSVRLANMHEGELGGAIQRLAQERFDFAVGRDQLSYLNAGQVRSGSETRNEIIMLQAARQTVEDHLGMLSEMGLVPEQIDSEPTALFRAVERHLRRRADERAVSVIMDMGKSATRVVVARGRQIVFIKSIEIGGRRLTEAVAKQLNLSDVEAGELRERMMQEQFDSGDTDEGAREPKTSVQWTIHDAIRGEVESLAREVALCLRYCAVTFRGLRPDRITVVGGEAYDPTLMRLLNEQVSIRCQIGHPLKGFDVSGVDFGADRRDTLSEWAVCTGLALRNADLAGTTKEVENATDNRLSA